MIAEATSYYATEAAESTLVAQFPKICSRNYPASFSPNGGWMAMDCPEHKSLQVTNRDGSRKWAITYQQVLEPYRDNYKQMFEYLTVDGFETIHWPADDQYFYFIIWLGPQPSIGSPYLNFDMNYRAQPLYRLNVSTGVWGELIHNGNYFSFSPTDRRLVTFIADSYECKATACHLLVSILDLKTGNLSEHDLRDTLAAGYVVWTQDGAQFFFSAMQKSSSNPLAFYCTIYSVETITDAVTILQRYNDTYDLVYPVSWRSENVLTIKTEKQYPENGLSYQYLDLNTNSFLSPTPTS